MGEPRKVSPMSEAASGKTGFGYTPMRCLCQERPTEARARLHLGPDIALRALAARAAGAALAFFFRFCQVVRVFMQPVTTACAHRE